MSLRAQGRRDSGAPPRPAEPLRAARGRGAPVREPTRSRGGAPAVAHAHAWRVTGRGERSAARLSGPGFPAPQPPSRTQYRRGPARPHVPCAVCVPLGGAQRHGVRCGRDLPGVGAQQHALVVSCTGAQWRDGVRAACLPASSAGECVPPCQASRPNPFTGTHNRSRKPS